MTEDASGNAPTFGLERRAGSLVRLGLGCDRGGAGPVTMTLQPVLVCGSIWSASREPVVRTRAGLPTAPPREAAPARRTGCAFGDRGVLMGRLGCSMTKSWEIFVEASGDTALRLRVVAETITAAVTGKEPLPRSLRDRLAATMSTALLPARRRNAGSRGVVPQRPRPSAAHRLPRAGVLIRSMSSAEACRPRRAAAR